MFTCTQSTFLNLCFYFGFNAQPWHWKEIPIVYLFFFNKGFFAKKNSLWMLYSLTRYRICATQCRRLNSEFRVLHTVFCIRVVGPAGEKLFLISFAKQLQFNIYMRQNAPSPKQLALFQHTSIQFCSDMMQFSRDKISRCTHCWIAFVKFQIHFWAFFGLS